LENDDLYARAEANAFFNLFHFMRTAMFDQSKILELSQLTYKLVQWMSGFGVSEVKQSTKKHIHRKIISEFGDAIQMVQTKSNKVLIYPDGLTRDELVIANYEMQSQIAELNDQCLM
jgi:hypothetical protein